MGFKDFQPEDYTWAWISKMGHYINYYIRFWFVGDAGRWKFEGFNRILGFLLMAGFSMMIGVGKELWMSDG
jgi:hypothetical protein